MAGSYGSKLCSLNWNSHHSTIVSVLDSLLERECLVDVTLAAEGKFINVHRFMLFACSPYFEVTCWDDLIVLLATLFLFLIHFLQELLTQQPKKQAVIFLKDVTFSNLQALVNVSLMFIYLLMFCLLINFHVFKNYSSCTGEKFKFQKNNCFLSYKLPSHWKLKVIVAFLLHSSRRS